MRARIVIVLAAIAVFVAFCAVVKNEQDRNGRLALEAARLERFRANRLSLKKENDRLRQVMSSLGDLAALKRRHQQIELAKNAVNSLDLQIRLLKRNLGQPADPVWPEGAAVLPSSEWRFAGQASPADTVESVLWTARTGDVDGLAGLIAMDKATKAKADAYFSALPGEARAQFGSSEKIVATLIAAQMPTDYAAMATFHEVDPDPSTALLAVRIQEGSGNQRDLTFKFEREQDNWRLDVPSSVVGNLARQLNPAPAPR